MPYIVSGNRVQFDDEIDTLVRRIRENENVDGDTNYVLSRIANGAFKPTGGWRYAAIARAIGCVTCVLLELYRRQAAIYEDKCIEKNGDIQEYAGLI